MVLQTGIIFQNNGIVEKFPGDGISAHFLKLDHEASLALSRYRALLPHTKIQTYMRQLGNKGYRISMLGNQQ